MAKPAAVRDNAMPGTKTAASLLRVDHKTVGARLRQTRQSRELTLGQLSERSGIALSTISKAERGEIALTYDKFAALARALQIDFDKIFGDHAAQEAGPTTPVLTRSGMQVVYETSNYETGMIANDLIGKRMVPMRARIRARSMSDFPDYIRHSGEEFVFVLNGRLDLHFENGAIFSLDQGDSLYFDSALGHVYVSAGEDDADVLVCCVDTEEARPPQTL